MGKPENAPHATLPQQPQPVAGQVMVAQPVQTVAAQPGTVMGQQVIVQPQQVLVQQGDQLVLMQAQPQQVLVQQPQQMVQQLAMPTLQVQGVQQHQQPMMVQQTGATGGDWVCGACGDYQFARNKHCRRCGSPGPAEAAGGQQYEV